jgi:hypothetical protein
MTHFSEEIERCREEWQCWKEALSVGVGAMALQLWCKNKELKKQQVVHFEMQCDDDNLHWSTKVTQNKNIANKTNKGKQCKWGKNTNLELCCGSNDDDEERAAMWWWSHSTWN